MKILIVGESQNLLETQEKFGQQHQYTHGKAGDLTPAIIKEHEVVFDFLLHKDPERALLYANQPASVFVDATRKSLWSFFGNRSEFETQFIFGFNGLPTFLNRDILEVCALTRNAEPLLNSLCEKLGTKYLLVDDRVGLVTPRVICMIINEAFFTVQEGTATKSDIDQAMKLGTNYPYGPFEWADRIGIQHVCELLEAVYNDTKDERYKIAPLLKRS
jgi:3-hydroxybutyryl-CoA dehydrogenase